MLRIVLADSPIPLRFTIDRREDARAYADSPFDFVEAEGTTQQFEAGAQFAWRLDDVRVLAVKALDLLEEAYGTSSELKDALSRFIDRLAGFPQLLDAGGDRPRIVLSHVSKRVLHLETNAEPSRQQLEGFRLARDYAGQRARECGTDIELVVASPAGKVELRSPAPQERSS